MERLSNVKPVILIPFRAHPGLLSKLPVLVWPTLRRSIIRSLWLMVYSHRMGMGPEQVQEKGLEPMGPNI